jgi:hypothetical protein
LALSPHDAALRRWALAMTAGVFLLWVFPLGFAGVVASFERETLAGQAWRSAWFVPILLSLTAWFLPPAWFQPQPWERGGRVYEPLGVRWFKRFMIGGDLMNRHVRREEPRYRIYADEAMRTAIAQQSIVSEKVHTIMFLCALWPALLGAAAGWWWYAAFTCAANLIVNVYPIMVQRYARARLIRVKR